MTKRRVERVEIGDELFEGRCTQGCGVARVHGALELDAGLVSTTWAPPGYSETRTASVWARPVGDGDYEVMSCTWLPGGSARAGGRRWQLTSGRVSRRAVDGRHGVLRCPTRVARVARMWTVTVQRISAVHPAAVYARAVEDATTRVLEELHSLNVPRSVVWAGWVARRTVGEAAFDFQYMLRDAQTDVRRRWARDGIAAALERGRVVTELRRCAGCGDPAGGELFASARRALGLVPAAPQLAS